MKIAILTLPFHSNYGGILQAYALQTVLQQMGHEVVVMDTYLYRYRPWWRQQVTRGAYLVRKYLLGKETDYVNARRAYWEKPIIEQHLRHFVDTRLNVLRIKDLSEEFPLDVQAVIVGSDQVWRNKYFSVLYGCGMEYAFLSFLEGKAVKRISYAASFGTAEWEYSKEDTERCARLLKQFDAVSVREASAVDLCREKLDRADAVQMPDPALLLSADDYRALFDSSDLGEPYLFYYVLDETDEIRGMAESIARERSLAIKRITGDVDDDYRPVSERIKAPVEDWLCGVANAEFVFTDSYHACVFSIIFDKPFKVLGNKVRGMDRFNSLFAQFKQGSYPASLDELRKKALDFLNRNLNGVVVQ